MENKDTIGKKVETFFDGYSSEFDSIYDDKKNTLVNRIINKYLRYSMFNRYSLTINKILENESQQKILDIGCGTGRYCLKLAEHGHEVLGIDVAHSMIENAKKINSRYLNSKVKFQLVDYLDFINNTKFDYSILMGFFDYIEKPTEVFDKLKNDSRIALSSFPKKFHWLTPQRAIRYNLRKCPIYFYTRTDLINMMKKINAKGFQIIDNHREYFLISEFN